ncbi:MAG: prenyltransferase/squalene oxidase repeat-containing protein, partial [Pirellulales bacterium]
MPVDPSSYYQNRPRRSIAAPNRSAPRPPSSVRMYAPPWLVSAVVHMTLLVILGLVVIRNDALERLLLEARVSDELGDQLDNDTFDFANSETHESDQPMLVPNQLPLVEDPLAAPPTFDVVHDANQDTSFMTAPTIGIALSGRERGMKQALLAAYGGTARTEGAVREALKWLARQQRRDGSWSLKGPYRGGAYDENRVAATAMALLAFQGAGYHHLEAAGDPFHGVVRRGLQVLLKQEDKDGNFFHSGPSHHRLYTQAQATIAVCELYGMTRDKALRERAQQAVDYCVRVQSKSGGWRYYPGDDGDTSVTGWFTMALESARMAYVAVPEATFGRIGEFLDSVALDGGSRYLYRPGGHTGLAMNAEGLLCRQYLGWKRDDPRLLAGVE